jgi:hypothetical protein
MSKLLSKNTALVSIKDISKSEGILSAKYHINKLNGLRPYIKKNGRYTPAKTNINAEYLNETQVKHINNLLIGIDLIEMEIENIKKTENYGKRAKQRKAND